MLVGGLISLRRHNMIWSDISWLSRSIYSRIIMSFGLERDSEADPVVRGSEWDKEDQHSEQKSDHISMRENMKGKQEKDIIPNALW